MKKEIECSRKKNRNGTDASMTINMSFYDAYIQILNFCRKNIQEMDLI